MMSFITYGKIKIEKPRRSEGRYKKDGWPVYESNVQSYRGFFFTTQSIMLAIGAVILNRSALLTLIVSIVSIIQIWYLWFRVIFSRCKIVDFYKFEMHDKFDNNGDPIDKKGTNVDNLKESAYVENKHIYNKVNEGMTSYFHYRGKFKTIRATRFKIDVLMPLLMTFIWIAFVIDAFFVGL